MISGVVVAALLVILFLLARDVYYRPGVKDYKLDQIIDGRNRAYAKGNIYGFTDRNHTKAKPKGIYRIAVLGDSFIWGSGLPYEQAWSHRLEAKLQSDYDSIEVLHWGTCGWSTLDEFNFFKQHGKDYDIDLLILAWVDNDPDMGHKPQVRWLDPAIEYPRLYKVLPNLAQKLVNDKEHGQYNDWGEYNYTDSNLVEYQQCLCDFYRYLDSLHVSPLCVMVPNTSFDWMQRGHFKKIEPIIRKANFPCLNMFGPVEKLLGHYSDRELQANPVNAHPGILMTNEFATEVEDYLQQNNYLKTVPKRNRVKE